MGSSKYGTTYKNTQQYYTPKHLIRCIYYILYDSSSVFFQNEEEPLPPQTPVQDQPQRGFILVLIYWHINPLNPGVFLKFMC